MSFSLCVRTKLISVSSVSHLVLVSIFPFLQGSVFPLHPAPSISAQLFYFLFSCFQILLSLKTLWLSRGDVLSSCLSSQLAHVPVGTAKPESPWLAKEEKPALKWHQESSEGVTASCATSISPNNSLWHVYAFLQYSDVACSMLNLWGIHRVHIKLKRMFSDIVPWEQALEVWNAHRCRKLPQIQLFPRWL